MTPQTVEPLTNLEHKLNHMKNEQRGLVYTRQNAIPHNLSNGLTKVRKISP